MKGFLFCLILAPLCSSINDWHPVLPADVFHHSQDSIPKSSSFSSLVAQQYQNPSIQDSRRQCELYKVAFIQDLYFQYIQYKVVLPRLKELTLCYWAKFYNHSNDHPIFSYAVEDQPRAILAWISNTDRSSYFSLSIHGHTLYRLNYPLRLNRWYHTCQSWNGRTGEWQIWVNAERVGRGFLNRLVDHKIPSGGIAITGQEQTQYGGGFIEGEYAPKGAGGMLGEITMLQLYRVALTAGKAHKDHKHHHAHQFDHNGMPITTTIRPTTSPKTTLPAHPLLTGGQLNPAVALNIASGQTQTQPQSIPGQSFSSQLLNGQFIYKPLVEQYNGLLGQGSQTFGSQGGSLDFIQQPRKESPLFQPSRGKPLLPSPGPPLLSGELIHYPQTNAHFANNLQIETHQLFKRNHKEEKTLGNEDLKTERIDSQEQEFGKKLTIKVKRQTETDKQIIGEIKSNSDKEAEEKQTAKKTKRNVAFEQAKGSHSKSKRQLPLGSYGSDTPSFFQTFEQSLLYGLAGIGDNEPILEEQKKDEREPAEAEVAAVMNICSGCDEEPFEKALVFGWRTVPKKLYSGAYYMPATTQCRLF